MRSRSVTSSGGATRLVCLAGLLVLALAAPGCGGGLFGMDVDKDMKLPTGAPASGGQGSDGVMKAEDDTVALEGTWTWPSLKVDYTDSPQNPRIYPTEREGEGWTFTIVRNGSGFATAAGGTVSLTGTSVTVTEESGSGDSISFTGEVKGDTIEGTVHRSVAAKTLSSGVAQGAGEYDGPWTATRVK